MHGVRSRTLWGMHRLPSPPLSETEWRAMALDGETYALGDRHLCIDSPPTVAERATALSAAVEDDRLFAERLTAAWVHGWLAVEPAAQLAARICARVPSAVRRRLGAREVVIGDVDLQRIAGVAVTTPLRTLVDLAREAECAMPQAVLSDVIRASGISAAEVLAHLENSPRAPFQRRARERLLAVADAVDVVDGVDAPDGVEDAVQVRDVAHLEHKLADRQAVA